MNREALLYRALDGGKVMCYLCAHCCVIPDGELGKCAVRRNENGVLFTEVYGELAAANVDPIEKKPLYHFLPGTRSFSIATRGCNFRCGFCQNWQLSQSPVEKRKVRTADSVPCEQIIHNAIDAKCKSISYTYSEPTIFIEYAYDIARLASAENIKNVFVTNGFMTKKAADLIRPYLDAANIDLKSFSDKFYAEKCGGRLAPVLETIKHMRSLGIWIELTTLLIPGENDGEEELKGLAGFIAGVDINIPWHISRFHPDYKFTDHQDTPESSMVVARDIGRLAGLKYVYLGNVRGDNHTRCPGCGEVLVERGYMDCRTILIRDSKCLSCGEKIAGVWE